MYPTAIKNLSIVIYGQCSKVCKCLYDLVLPLLPYLSLCSNTDLALPFTSCVTLNMLPNQPTF